jgi:hypothetical protein
MTPQLAVAIGALLGAVAAVLAMKSLNTELKARIRGLETETESGN